MILLAQCVPRSHTPTAQRDIGLDQFWPGPDGFRSLQLVIELSQPLRSPRGQPGTKPQLCHGDEEDQCRPALDERLIRLSERPRPAG